MNKPKKKEKTKDVMNFTLLTILICIPFIYFVSILLIMATPLSKGSG